MKKYLKFLLPVGVVMIFASCEVVRDVAYKPIDYVSSVKDNEWIYHRDTINNEGVGYSNFGKSELTGKRVEEDSSRKAADKVNYPSARIQNVLSAPKVAFQKRHSEFCLTPGAGHKTLFYIMTITTTVLFIVWFCFAFRNRWWLMRAARLDKKADKREGEGKAKKRKKAEKLRARGEQLRERSREFGEDSADPKKWYNVIVPWCLLLITLLEAVYLFLFNFTMPFLSPLRVGLIPYVFNTVLLLVMVFAQYMFYVNYRALIGSGHKTGRFKLATRSMWWLMVPFVFAGMLLGGYIDIAILIVSAIQLAINIRYIDGIDKASKAAYCASMALMPIVFLYFVGNAITVLLITLVFVLAVIAVVKVAMKVSSVRSERRNASVKQGIGVGDEADGQRSIEE